METLKEYGLNFFATDKDMARRKAKNFCNKYRHNKGIMIGIRSMYRIVDNTWNVKFIEVEPKKGYILPKQ